MTISTPSPAPSRHVDGNATAGALAQVFGADVTDAMGTCNSCGHRAALAQARAYTAGPGVVLRCPGCESILIRWATTPTTTWLEMPGLSSLELALRL
jgi:hypothetical protein